MIKARWVHVMVCTKVLLADSNIVDVKGALAV
jgi:hypothetical protein